MPHGHCAIHDDRERPAVSVVVPAYREAEHIARTLQDIVETLHAAHVTSEIVVVVDLIPGDETASQIRKVSQSYSEIRVIEREGRRGVGDAIRTGIKRATGNIVIPVMGDQSESPSDVVRLAKTAQDCDIVFTDRFRRGRPPGYPVMKYIANRCCNFAARLLLRIPYRDTTNAFKAYRRMLLNRVDLSSKGFEIFLEMPLKAMMVPGVRVEEIEVSHTVKRKKAPKLSIAKDGYRYAELLLKLCRRKRA